MILYIELLKTLIIGIIQGVTEWLPVSSTGHMILFNSLWGLKVSPDFWDMFSVVIQLGSILAVVVIYFRRLNPFAPSKTTVEKKSTWNLWGKVVVGSIPLGIVGILIDDLLGSLLYENENELEVRFSGAVVIAAALIVYGVAFILIEKLKKTPDTCKSTDEISYKKAVGIGLFEALAVIPGTSRSGSTILGARLLGVSRVTAAEFSFFLAIPAMLGASLLKIVKYIFGGFTMSISEWAILTVGCVVAFVVSLVAVKFLTDFVKKHTFIPFGIYRIVLGAAVILWVFLK